MNETQRVGPSFLQAGTWARTECHGGRPYFVIFFVVKSVTHLFGEKCHAIKKTEMSRNEKTEMSQSWVEFLAGHHDSNMKV